MKTITAQQAEKHFSEYAQIAHDGERILVILDGKPWVMLSPPIISAEAKPTAEKLEWPDFAGRLARYYLQPVEGPTATELLAQDKEDRF
jgi:antitoxin (DNA-binding transcriptional repressor) of toxin-antitoxin stability system